MAEAIKGITQAIELSKPLAVEQKTEALQTVETLSEQAQLPAGEHRPGTYKSALSYLSTLLSFVVSGVKIWETFGPAIESFFKSV